MKNIILFAAIISVLASCTSDKSQPTGINEKAALPAALGLREKNFRVITSGIDKKQGTMFTLFGNAEAVKFASTGKDSTGKREIFTLVTWVQVNDPAWYGGKIPGEVQRVEIVKITGNSAQLKPDYELYKGKKADLVANPPNREERIRYILSQKASIMP